jgi:tetratricopeptide (TPR) repeat protein
LLSSRQILRLGLSAALAAAAGTGTEAAESLQRYVQLVELYESGARLEALRELSAWQPDRLSDVAGALLEWQAGADQVVAYTRLSQAAALMHAELSLASADVGDELALARQVLTIRQLLRSLHRRERSAAAALSPGSIPVRELYLATASLHLAIGAVPQANTLLVEYFAAEMGRQIPLREDFSLAEYPPEELGLPGPVQVDALIARHLAEDGGDVPMLLLAGCAQDALAMLITQSTLDDRGPRTRDALRRAEGFFRSGLELEPDSPELQLRLGWLLIRRGELQGARPLLEAATANAHGATRGYLAWLFLGRLEEISEEPAAALAAFERATALVPGAPAARLALARARELEEGYLAASQVLRPLLEEKGVEDVVDSRGGPWTLYATGPEELRFRPLEELRRQLSLR